MNDFPLTKANRITPIQVFRDVKRVDLSDFDSADDFVERGLGYCLLANDVPVACAYASSVCSKGIEVSIFVRSEYRRKGVATAMACALLRDSLTLGLDPYWDAANPESCRLAERFGYVPTGTYLAYFLKK